MVNGIRARLGVRFQIITISKNVRQMMIWEAPRTIGQTDRNLIPAMMPTIPRAARIGPVTTTDSTSTATMKIQPITHAAHDRAIIQVATTRHQGLGPSGGGAYSSGITFAAS